MKKPGLANNTDWNKGSILPVAMFMLLITVTIFIKINEVYKSSITVIEQQNKMDAHMLSVAGYYVDIFDEVTWINKQLRRIAALCALLTVITPELTPLIKTIDKSLQGLKKYQDFLLKKLKFYAPVLDIKLRKENNISIIPNIHYFKYRRQPDIKLVFITIPGLIEFDKDMFNTVCIKHSNHLTSTSACIDHEEYKNIKRKWFAPVKDKWTVRFKSA